MNTLTPTFSLSLLPLSHTVSSQQVPFTFMSFRLFCYRPLVFAVATCLKLSLGGWWTHHSAYQLKTMFSPPPESRLGRCLTRTGMKMLTSASRVRCCLHLLQTAAGIVLDELYWVLTSIVGTAVGGAGNPGNEVPKVLRVFQLSFLHESCGCL